MSALRHPWIGSPTVVEKLDRDRPCHVAGCRFESLPAPAGPYVGLCGRHRRLLALAYRFPGLRATVEGMLHPHGHGEERVAA